MWHVLKISMTSSLLYSLDAECMVMQINLASDGFCIFSITLCLQDCCAITQVHTMPLRQIPRMSQLRSQNEDLKMCFVAMLLSKADLLACRPPGLGFGLEVALDDLDQGSVSVPLSWGSRLESRSP